MKQIKVKDFLELIDQSIPIEFVDNSVAQPICSCMSSSIGINPYMDCVVEKIHVQKDYNYYEGYSIRLFINLNLDDFYANGEVYMTTKAG